MKVLGKRSLRENTTQSGLLFNFTSVIEIFDVNFLGSSNSACRWTYLLQPTPLYFRRVFTSVGFILSFLTLKVCIYVFQWLIYHTPYGIPYTIQYFVTTLAEKASVYIKNGSKMALKWVGYVWRYFVFLKLILCRTYLILLYIQFWNGCQKICNLECLQQLMG